jgi:hypothetical protein
VGKQLAIIAGAIVLMTAVAMLLVNRFTAPATPLTPRAERAAAAAAERQAEPAPLQPAATPLAIEPGPGGAIELPGSNPLIPGPVPNESRPIQGPAPIPLPIDAEERQDALRTIRQQRRSDQMEKLNRRNQQRLGASASDLEPSEPPPQDK